MVHIGEKRMNKSAVKKKSIGIIVIGYNRLQSIMRLLNALQNANYPKMRILLIISLDYSKDTSIKEFAELFKWNYGEKILRLHRFRLGLREHVLQCGNYINEYNLDAAIIFEDDIFPAKDFYTYAEQAVEKYCEDDNVAGIALYSPRLNQNGGAVFEPAHSQYDNFFMQYACSWGQIWLKKQWNDFYQWYLENKDLSFDSLHIPINVFGWPEDSWLKYHIRYCIEKEKYFVYPYVSLTTNFHEQGVHATQAENWFQVPFLEGVKDKYNFGSISDAVKYDAFFERIGLGHIVGVEEEQLCVDLYGRQMKHRNRRYWLTQSKEYYLIKSRYGKRLKLLEDNVRYGISGNEIFLYDTWNIDEYNWNNPEQILNSASITNGSKALVLVGAGYGGECWLKKLQNENIGVLCFADSSKSKTGEELCGKRIFSFRDLKKIQDHIKLFITVMDEDMRKEIRCALCENGFQDQIVESPYMVLQNKL